MGVTLTNTAIKDTYEGLVKTSDNSAFSSTAKYLSDGLGNDSLLSISTTAVGIGNAAPIKELDVTGSIRASEGILFGTDTAPANMLDDYEEGNFTPVIKGDVTDGTASYISAYGNYTKIGRVVHFNITIWWTSGTGTGALMIGDLPFGVASIPGTVSNPSFSFSNADISFLAGTILAAEGREGTKDIVFASLPIGGGPRQQVPYAASGSLTLSGTYFA
jgi:hypothetical protein